MLSYVNRSGDLQAAGLGTKLQCPCIATQEEASSLSGQVLGRECFLLDRTSFWIPAVPDPFLRGEAGTVTSRWSKQPHLGTDSPGSSPQGRLFEGRVVCHL